MTGSNRRFAVRLDLKHGAVDMIVDRREMRDRLANLITLLMRVAPA